MQIVYAHQPMPERFERSLFLAGPSPRGAVGHDWRPAAIEALEAQGYDGVVFVPLPADGHGAIDYVAQVSWEARAMESSDVLLFWVPRDLETLPGFTTNIEWGRWESSGRVVLGYPKGAPKMRYLHHWAERWAAPVRHTLPDTVASALKRLGPGAARTGGECGVPLDIWRSQTFSAWYAAQRGAGNRLDRARVRWVHRVGKGRRWLVIWALAVDMYIASEDRNKRSEIVFGRTDIAAVVVYEAGAPSVAETRVALVREFRSCGRTTDGFVHELAGGSSFDPALTTRQVAAEELHEELGLVVDPADLVEVGCRQAVATLSAHAAAVFALPLSTEAMDAVAASVGPFGVAGSSERTWPEVCTVGSLLAQRDVDWSNLGMILAALTPEGETAPTPDPIRDRGVTI